MTENFIHFAKKKIAELLTNLLDLQNSSDHTQPQQIIANYTLCLQVAQDYNIMYHSIRGIDCSNTCSQQSHGLA